MPHLTELQKKYEGKVVITGVNIWEEREPKDDSYIAKVEKYVNEFGDKMGYRVAADDPKGTIAKDWMAASESNGIPTSFIVNGEGTILWIGHPMALGKPLQEILDGTFDAKAAAEKDAKRREANRERREMYAGLNAAMVAKDYPKAIAEIDKLVEKKPELALNLGMTKFNVMLQSDEAAAYKWAEKMLDGPAKDNPNALNSLAWSIVDDESPIKLKSPNYKLAVKIAERANELAKAEDPFILDTLAYAQFKNGQVDKALENQKKAVKIAESQGDFPADTLKELRDRLEMMKAKKKKAGGGGG